MTRVYRDGWDERTRVSRQVEIPNLKQTARKALQALSAKKGPDLIITQEEAVTALGVANFRQLQDLLLRAFDTTVLDEVLRHLGLPSKKPKKIKRMNL